MNGCAVIPRPIPESATPLSWSAAELAAIDALRGVSPGTIVEDELVGDGHVALQTTVVTDHGAVVLASWVPVAEVPDAQRIFVWQHVSRVRRHLNLGQIAVRYFGPPQWVEDEEIALLVVNRAHPTFDLPLANGQQRLLAGLTTSRYPWTISLHVSLAGDELIRTIAHEIRHVDQRWGAGLQDGADRERDAAAFADSWMERC